MMASGRRTCQQNTHKTFKREREREKNNNNNTGILTRKKEREVLGILNERKWEIKAICGMNAPLKYKKLEAGVWVFMYKS